MNLGTYGAVVVAAGIALAFVGSTSCNEPPPKCTVALGSFTAAYKLVSGSGPCAMLTGDVLSLQEYTAVGQNNYPDYDHASLSIVPTALTTALSGTLTDMNASDQPYALGAFTTANPADNGFCVAPKMSSAHVRLAAVDAVTTGCMPTPAMPAVDVQYDFSNVSVLSTARALGTELFADLTYTDAINGCTAKYEVAAVYPSVGCGVAAPTPEAGAGDDAAADTGTTTPNAGDDGGVADGAVPEGGGPADATPGDDATTAMGGGDDAGDVDCGAPMASMPATPMVASDMACNAFDNGTGFGSGISPDFAVKCDPTLLLCVLANPTPP